jgi:phosphoglycerate kinase
MAKKSLESSDLALKSVLIRVDFNVPVDEDGDILDDTRILKSLPTIKLCLEKKAKVFLVSHLGRPKVKSKEKKHSLRKVSEKLSRILNMKVDFFSSYFDNDFSKTNIGLFENSRLVDGEIENDQALSKKISDLFDVFVFDAFASAHRAEVTTCGVSKFIEEKYFGLLVKNEIMNLNKIINNPSKPILSIVGGSKVSTKLPLLENMIQISDYFIPGGGIANNFLLAHNCFIGASLSEKNLINETKKLIKLAESKKTKIIYPIDCVVSDSIEGSPQLKDSFDSLKPNDMIFDFGPKTSRLISGVIEKAETVLWNGPLGVFEKEQFSESTKNLSINLSKSNAFKVVGGGDTIMAINKFNIVKSINYISTAGGAFLDYISGKKLPALEDF